MVRDKGGLRDVFKFVFGILRTLLCFPRANKQQLMDPVARELFGPETFEMRFCAAEIGSKRDIHGISEIRGSCLNYSLRFGIFRSFIFFWPLIPLTHQ